MTPTEPKSQSWGKWLSAPIRSLLKWVYPSHSFSPLIKEEYPKQVVMPRLPGRYSMPPHKILECYAPTHLPEFKEQEKTDMS
jgi:hypothetical protein